MERNLLIYVVEDSPTQALSVKRTLKSLQPLEVISFSDGLEAHRAIQASPPDLILMDLLLPSLHGLALCRLLKFHSDFQCIPILIFSSITETDILEQTQAAGADDFLPKPFTPESLLSRVQKLRPELYSAEASRAT